MIQQQQNTVYNILGRILMDQFWHFSKIDLLQPVAFPILFFDKQPQDLECFNQTDVVFLVLKKITIHEVMRAADRYLHA